MAEGIIPINEAGKMTDGIKNTTLITDIEPLGEKNKAKIIEKMIHDHQGHAKAADKIQLPYALFGYGISAFALKNIIE